MLKHSSESCFNSLVPATSTSRPLPLDCWYRPRNSRSQLTLAIISPKGRVLEVGLGSLGAKHLQQRQVAPLISSAALWKCLL